MSSLRTHHHLASALLAAGLFTGCQAPVSPPAPQSAAVAPPAAPGSAPTPAAAAEPILRTYDAPPGRAGDLANVLQRVLRRGDDTPLGKATAVDGDRVLVVAPEGIHAGVEHLCTQMRQVEATPARSVRLSYWIVRAEPADATDTSSVPELAEALQTVADTTGPATFTLTERATLSSMLNAQAKTKGPNAEFEQIATAAENAIVADLVVDVHSDNDRGRLRTRIAIDPGKTVMIGQNGGAEDGDARLFYIVRAELDDAA